jgi:two-component system, OmpR family, alkaline phosphatase synthesis response regulator PhoP
MTDCEKRIIHTGNPKTHGGEMAKESILIVDDEEDILELISYNLVREGYRIFTAKTGGQALDSARKENPGLIVLDLMLPGIDGLEVCRNLKSDSLTRHIPVIMVTAKGEDADIVTGLELGADDYITKPFSPRVLLARVRAVLRRDALENSEEPLMMRTGVLVVDIKSREVTVGEEPVQLTATEFNVLSYLMKKPGWVFTRNQIINAIKGEDYPVTERSVDVQIVGLRKKLGLAGKYVQTIRGIGYRFKE